MSFDEEVAPDPRRGRQHAASVDRDSRFPDEAIGALRERGLLGLTLPDTLGGRGGTPTDFLAVTRAIASRCASTAMVFLMHICAAQVTLAGTSSGDSEELRAMADGSNLSTLAFSERGSRSHFWAPVSQLVGSRLSAQKSFVTSAGHAATYVVSTRQPSGHTDGSSLTWSPHRPPGSRSGTPGTGWGSAGTPARRWRSTSRSPTRCCWARRARASTRCSVSCCPGSRSARERSRSGSPRARWAPRWRT